MPRRLLTLTLFLALRCTAPAGPVVDVRLSAIAWDDALDGVIVKTAGRTVEWDIPAFNRSTALDYRGESRIVFFRKPPAGAAGDETLTPLAETELPEGAGRVLLLFFPAADGRHRVYPVRDDAEGHPPGRARLMNATARPLAILAGGETFRLMPGETRLVPGDGRKLAVKVAVEQDGSWRRVASHVLPLGPEQRRSVFFTASEAAFFRRLGPDGVEGPAGPVQVFTVED